MSEQQWRNDGPDIYARKAPDESLFDDDVALIGPVGVVSYLNKLEATIAQQQARIEAAETEIAQLRNRLVEEARRGMENGQARMEAEQALTAEREKSAEHLDAANWLTLERQRLTLEVERLEALARLATRAWPELYMGNNETADNWMADYSATWAAPEADHVGGLMSIPTYKAPEARQ